MSWFIVFSFSGFRRRMVAHGDCSEGHPSRAGEKRKMRRVHTRRKLFRLRVETGLGATSQDRTRWMGAARRSQQTRGRLLCSRWAETFFRDGGWNGKPRFPGEEAGNDAVFRRRASGGCARRHRKTHRTRECSSARTTGKGKRCKNDGPDLVRSGTGRRGRFGGLARNRTGVQGFAVLCVTTPPRGHPML